jgi:hypothetical protein
MTAAIAPNYEKLADVLLLPSTVKTIYWQHYKAILQGFFFKIMNIVKSKVENSILLAKIKTIKCGLKCHKCFH